MNESFELAEPDAPFVSASISVFADGDSDRLGDRSSLGVSLSQITSRLVRQLAIGSDGTADGGIVAASPRRDTRGNRVPRDDSPLVSWKRVIAVSGAGSLMALVSMPIQSGPARMELRGTTA